MAQLQGKTNLHFFQFWGHNFHLSCLKLVGVRSILIYLGVHCCTKVCNLLLDISSIKKRDNWIPWTEGCLLAWKGIYKNYVPFTDQLQTIYFTYNGLYTKPIGFKYKLSNVWRIMLWNPMKALLKQGCLNQWSFTTRDGRQLVIGWKDVCGIWLLSRFYRELISGCITDCKGSDTTCQLRMCNKMKWTYSWKLSIEELQMILCEEMTQL